ncbi:PilW family protein [uncultured Oxalicibacterium sp.]|uniref:PilW family protein n=1 Tax=uncultured Oxalicibacterium sp. TaxID=1168540 RepID=UPI0026004FB0|nr:PilW family protein [uncultured Oxalicibacterium sp.]
MKRAYGFSLVEIMIAIVIGMVTLLAVTQMMASSAAQRQSATAGADSTINAALGLYSIERDGKNAGYIIGSVRSILGCQVRAIRGGTSRNFSLLPVQIADGASGVPDTIQFLAGNKSGIALPTRVAADHAQAASNFYVDSDVGMQAGDLVIAATAALDTTATPSRWCTLLAVTQPPSGAATNMVWHETSNAWNPSTSIMPATGYVVGDYLINVGSLSDQTYSINSSNHLQVVTYDWVANQSVTQDLQSNIVQLQAVYGMDTNADGVVDRWTADAPASPTIWQQIRVIRVAVVARSTQRESAIVTLDGAADASTCASTTPHPAALCWRPDPGGDGVKIDVNINNANPDWQHYRYTVMETTIPLRNVIWQQ